MPFDWFNEILKEIKSYGGKIDHLEHSVLYERRKFREVFERNIVLEKEITERTEELGQANKGLLTLKHIWSTMNSSEPLSEVLSTIVNGLSTNLGYIQCFILQIDGNIDSPALKIKASTENKFSSKIQDILQEALHTYSIPLNTSENIIVQSIKNRNIRFIKSFSQLLYGSKPGIEGEKSAQLDSLLGNRSIAILPIIVQEKPFGSLVVISFRNEVSDIEKNFLSLFAGQVELAVTIAGLFEQIREQAITDGMTGLFNRRYFEQSLASEADRSLRLKQPFTLISLDLDYLKQINDNYGHSAGDAAICHIGKVLRQNARSIDIPARIGGEEFNVILPGIDMEGGMIAAERLRAAIEAENLEGIGTVTASIGVGTFLKHTNSLTELTELVDQAMYRAKRNGRNQVQLVTQKEEMGWQQLALETFMDILTKQHIPIDPAVVKDITRQFKTPPTNEAGLSDFLYYISDSLVKTYDSVFQRGNTREKVELVSLIAEEAGLSKAEIDKLKIATLIYDVGIIMMPENILLKPGPLTKEERAKMLEHPIIAAREILKPIKSANPIIPLVEHHHEHWDGSGYPANLLGNDIPVGSRIILIVDAYFAMISDRPYRKALSKEEAVKTLKKGANNEWDGKLVDIFVKIIQKQKESVNKEPA